MYEAMVLPTLLYSAETCTLYRRQFRTLSQVYLPHLRQILRIAWKDHIPNVEGLRRANISSIEATLTASQLHCIGYIISIHPMSVFYGELAKRKSLRGGPRLRCKDVVKRQLNGTHIAVDTWETLAQDRQQWRHSQRKEPY